MCIFDKKSSNMCHTRQWGQLVGDPRHPPVTKASPTLWKHGKVIIPSGIQTWLPGKSPN